MARSLRVTSIALATCLATAAFNAGGAAFAQTPQLPPVRGYEVPTPQQPAQPTGPRTRVQRDGVTGLGARTPRFIVEAVSFTAVDESGPNNPLSDEVVALFESGDNAVISREFENVDTEDTETFGARERCILPLADTDGQRNERWDCAPGGAAGPLSFKVTLYEVDTDWTGWMGFCIRASSGDVIQRRSDPGCAYRNVDVLFRHEFNYDVAQILARLDPSCRCFTETARFHEEDWRGDLTYDVTIRVTRVDSQAPTFEINPGGVGPVPPAVYRSGSLAARYTQAFDFDAGAIGAAGDLLFSRVSNQDRLTPGGGGKIWLGDANARGYATCFAQRMSANYVTTAIALPAIGTHACYVTSDGRVGELRIDSLQPSPFGGSPLLTVSYTTWQ